MSLADVKVFIHVNDIDEHFLRSFELYVEGEKQLHSIWFNKIEDAYGEAKDRLYIEDPMYPDELAYVVANDENLTKVYIQMEGTDPTVQYMTPYNHPAPATTT